MTTTALDTAPAAARVSGARTVAAPAGSSRAASDHLVYRPLDPAWGDAEALAQLRAIRARRAAGYEQNLAMARAAETREQARRRAERTDRRSRRGHGRSTRARRAASGGS